MPLPKLEQRIDFVLTLKQIIEMISKPGTTGLKLTFGITETAEIVLSAEGVFWDSATTTMITTSDAFRPCPIPPNCPTGDLDCIKKAETLLPPSPQANDFIKIDVVNSYLNL